MARTDESQPVCSCDAPSGIWVRLLDMKNQYFAEVLGAYAERHSCRHLLEL